MANKTKAELLNEIKALQAAVKANEQWRRENNSEIKQLRDGATADAFEIRDLRNEIRDLQDVVVALRNDCNNLTAEKHEKANKVKELEQVLKTAVDMRDFWLEEKDSEISNLRRAAIVRAEATGVIAELRNEIKRLHQHIDDDEITIQNKQNEINNLRCDYDHRQAIIAEMSKEIKDLKVKVADLEQKRNDSRKFYWATEALGNPEHFHEVT